MQVRAAAEGMHLVAVAALVLSLASVQRLVHVGDQVHKVLEGFQALLCWRC